jgi:hypothetical protein
MDQLLCLVINKVAKVLVVVAERIDGDAGSEVDVPAILNIKEVASISLHKHLRRARIGSDHEREMLAHQRGALGVCRRIEGG